MKNLKTIELSVKQKNTLAIIISVLLVGSTIFTYLWFNTNLKNNLFKIGNTQDTKSQLIKDTVDKLGKSLDQVNLDSVIYDIISFKNLPVYPKAWVEKFFTPSEQANELISGPNADADNDGLTNKEEYFYASSPINKDTLCDGKIDGNLCKGKTDKQNVDQGISPLTGLTLDSYDKVKIKKQDYAILNRIQDSFENAAKEGVDFPTLYQLSKTIDLSAQYEPIKVLTQSNDRANIVNYISFRAKLLQDIADQGEVTLFSELYQSIKIEDIKKVKEKYTAKNEELKNTYTPDRFIELHKAYIFFFDKIIELLDIRIDGISKKITESVDFRNRSKTKGTEVMWSYRKLSEISNNLKIDLNEAQ
jgi:hypothetical protein